MRRHRMIVSWGWMGGGGGGGGEVSAVRGGCVQRARAPGQTPRGGAVAGRAAARHSCQRRLASQAARPCPRVCPLCPCARCRRPPRWRWSARGQCAGSQSRWAAGSPSQTEACLRGACGDGARQRGAAARRPVIPLRHEGNSGPLTARLLSTASGMQARTGKHWSILPSCAANCGPALTGADRPASPPSHHCSAHPSRGRA